MFKVLPVVYILATLGCSTKVQEPIWPIGVCTQLNAELTEIHRGYLPESCESKLDTVQIQRALDNCGTGNAVKLVTGSGNAFLSAHLKLPSGVTLWIDAGVTLFASRNPRDFDRTPYSCGIVNDNGAGCLPLISASHTENSGIVGLGTIDGRGGQMIIGSNETWWESALRAGAMSKHQNNPQLVLVDHSQDFTLYKVHLHNSPQFHFVTHNVDGLTVWGVTVDTPSQAYSNETHARNTDGFDPKGRNMVFSDLYVNTGDDHIAIKGPVANILVQNSHFYKGHGMSIGSQTNGGVFNVTVKNLSIDGADNGLRIKSDSSRGGVVSGIIYENICIRDTDAPLVFDAYYTDKNGTEIPDFQNIYIKNTHIVSSSLKMVVFRGYDKDFPLKISLDNVVSDIELSDVIASNAIVNMEPGDVSNIPLQTNLSMNVRVTHHSGKSTQIECSEMFVPLPR